MRRHRGRRPDGAHRRAPGRRARPRRPGPRRADRAPRRAGARAGRLSRTSGGRCSRASATTCARRSARCGPPSRRWPTAWRPIPSATCARCSATSRRSAALVDDLFLLARIEAGRLDLDRVPLDLSELVDEAVEALAPAAAARRVTHRARRSPAGVRVAGNPTALGRVVRNLLDNAIQHAPAGLGGARSRSTAATGRGCAVVDEGPGFPAEFSRPRLRALHPRRPEPQPRRPAAPGSGWPSPAASSRPTAAASGSTDRPAAVSRSTCPPPDETIRVFAASECLRRGVCAPNTRMRRNTRVGPTVSPRPARRRRGGRGRGRRRASRPSPGGGSSRPPCRPG